MLSKLAIFFMYDSSLNLSKIALIEIQNSKKCDHLQPILRLQQGLWTLLTMSLFIMQPKATFEVSEPSVKEVEGL